MDYAELVKAIGEYVECDETQFAGHVDDFIRGAERKIYLACKTVDSRTSITGTITTSQLSTTTDFIAPLSMVVTINGVQTPILPKGPTFIYEAFGAGTVGPPRYYAVLSSADPQTVFPPTTAVNLLIGPIPDAPYPYQLFYLRTPPSIVDAGTTWLSDHGHTCLFYRALEEAAVFLKAPEMLPVYKGIADEEQAKIAKLYDAMQNMDEFRN